MNSAPTSWKIWTVVVLGLYWSVNYGARSWLRWPHDLSALALLGILSPILVYYRPRWILRLIRGFCALEVLISALLLLGSVSTMNPVGFHVYILGFKMGTIWHLGAQAVFLGLRAAAFGSCIFLLSAKKEEVPNKALEPTA